MLVKAQPDLYCVFDYLIPLSSGNIFDEIIQFQYLQIRLKTQANLFDYLIF